MIITSTISIMSLILSFFHYFFLSHQLLCPANIFFQRCFYNFGKVRKQLYYLRLQSLIFGYARHQNSRRHLKALILFSLQSALDIAISSPAIISNFPIEEVNGKNLFTEFSIKFVMRLVSIF